MYVLSVDPTRKRDLCTTTLYERIHAFFSAFTYDFKKEFETTKNISNVIVIITTTATTTVKHTQNIHQTAACVIFVFL